jgi:hypothetical protein
MTLTGCGKNGNNGDTNTPTNPSVVETPVTSPKMETAENVGQGKTVFKFEVTDSENAVKTWSVHTDEKTVGAALVAVGLIKGDTSEHGLYVKEVNGIKADFDVDKSYWAFHVDGEYATKGVDSTNIETGKTYSFVYTKE